MTDDRLALGLRSFVRSDIATKPHPEKAWELYRILPRSGYRD
jgi:hypothetical protein